MCDTCGKQAFSTCGKPVGDSSQKSPTHSHTISIHMCAQYVSTVNLWKHVGNASNMWSTCGPHVENVLCPIPTLFHMWAQHFLYIPKCFPQMDNEWYSNIDWHVSHTYGWVT